MPPSDKTTTTFLGVLRQYRQLSGRKIYLLALLLPLATLAESFGITLLLPLLSALDDSQSLVGAEGGLLQGLLAWMPLPKSPLALLALIALAFLLKALLKFSVEAYRGFLQAQIGFRLKMNLLNAFTNLNYSAFSQRNSGHYINLVNGQATRFVNAFQLFASLMIQTAATLVYLAFATLVDWRFAILAAVAGVTFILVLRALTDYVRTLSRETAAEQSTLNKQLVQVLHALKYLIATNRTQSLVDRIRHSCQRLFHFQLRTNVAQAFSMSAREPLSVILVLSLVAIQIHFFKQPLGSIFVALLLLHRTTQTMFSLQGTWQQTMASIGSAEMIQDELEFAKCNRELRGTQKLEHFHQAVEFQSVSFAYNPADSEVLQDVALTIPRNHTVALVGHSGSGKSTLADLLTLLHRPGDGSIQIDGQDTQHINPETWRSRIGYVCQETVVFDETVAANICLTPDDYANDPNCRDRVRRAAASAFAAEFIDALPLGYETIVGDRGVRLSGGQRQRLFIARELYKQPELLILDEATSALDGASERAIQKSIDALRGQMTVLVIAHRLATIKNADYIYVLDQGRIVEEGPYEQLHAVADSAFRRMVELQSL